MIDMITVGIANLKDLSKISSVLATEKLKFTVDYDTFGGILLTTEFLDTTFDLFELARISYFVVKHEHFS